MTLFLSGARRRLFIYWFLCSHVGLVGAAAGIPDLLFVDESLPDEGFLWKRSLAIERRKGDSVSFEETHTSLYRKLTTFQSRLNLVDDPVELVKSIIIKPDSPRELHTIFRRLYEETETIGGILGDVEIQEDTFNENRIQKIIKSNFQRLKRRNFCIASFDYVSEEEPTKPKHILVTLNDRPVIFISGLGNEIIRILQIHCLFKEYSFVIFHNGKTNNDSISIEHFESSVRTLYNNVTPIITSNILIPRYKREVLKWESAKIQFKEIKKAAAKAIEEYLSPEEYFSHPDDREDTGRIVKIPYDLIGARDRLREAFVAFRDKFCDSEQALRYFLFAHIDKFLKPLSLTLSGILSLNIHSTMDPCKYCTNALFIESVLLTRPSFISTENKPVDVAFFQRFYNIQLKKPEAERKLIPQIFILVSSQKPESDGGILRRLTSGRTYLSGKDMDTPIPLDSSVRLYFRYNGPYASGAEETKLDEPVVASAAASSVGGGE